MKNISVRLITLALFIIFYLSSSAQTKDSLYNLKIIKDSAFQLKYPANYVPEIGYDKEAVRVLKSTRKPERQDSLMLKQRKLLDSTRKKATFTAHANFSNHLNASRYKKNADSLYKRQLFVTKKQDTLRKLNQLTRVKYDSSRKLYALNAKLDTFHKYKLYQSVKLDSINRKIYLQKMRSDSQRIKEYLREKKIRYRDTAVVKQELGSKNLSMEITCNPGDTVYINNLYKKVIIKIIPSQKLRLSTTLYYNREVMNERSPEIFKKMGIQLSRTNTSVTAILNGTKQSKPGNINDDQCIEDKITESNNRRALLVEVPGNVIIVVHSKYTETNIEGFVTSLKAEITNSSLRMGNADYTNIKSYYGVIKADDIKKAELNLTASSFTASNIAAMSVVSNSSTMQLNHCVTMNMASSGDEYNIDKAGSISGNKNFGKLNIENLKDQLVLTGASADIKIDNLSYEAPLVKINNKYADLKLPLYNQQNYAVYYEGSYNDVNKLSSATHKVNGTGTINARLSVQKDTLASMSKLANVNKTRFEAIAGNITGRHTKIDIVCPYCNVVFN